MPVVTINKTVALFLVGYLGLGVLIVVGPTMIGDSGEAAAWVIGTVLAMIVSAYALLSLALDRCLYTYQAEFRFAAIWLAELDAKKRLGAKA